MKIQSFAVRGFHPCVVGKEIRLVPSLVSKVFFLKNNPKECRQPKLWGDETHMRKHDTL